MEAIVTSLEISKKLKDFPTYHVFPDGRVYSTTTRMFLKPFPLGRKGREYPAVRIQEDNVKKTYRVHRLVAIAFIPNPENLPEVNHKDGNKFNPSADNLEWVSSRGNRLHAYATGLDSKAGERNGNARFTAIEIDEIRLHRYSKTSIEVGKLYGVSASYIRQIWSGNKWKQAK